MFWSSWQAYLLVEFLQNFGLFLGTVLGDSDMFFSYRYSSKSRLQPSSELFYVFFLKLINYSCADDPISLHHLSQVHVFWYPMNIPIKTHSISSKTDQDTDQETWILISLNTKYSIFAASIITYNNNGATYYSFNFSVVEIDRLQ